MSQVDNSAHRPKGADIQIRAYSDLNGEWISLGKTPIDSLKMPKYTF